MTDYGAMSDADFEKEIARAKGGNDDPADVDTFSDQSLDPDPDMFDDLSTDQTESVLGETWRETREEVYAEQAARKERDAVSRARMGGTYQGGQDEQDAQASAERSETLSDLPDDVFDEVSKALTEGDNDRARRLLRKAGAANLIGLVPE